MKVNEVKDTASYETMAKAILLVLAVGLIDLLMMYVSAFLGVTFVSLFPENFKPTTWLFQETFYLMSILWIGGLIYKEPTKEKFRWSLFLLFYLGAFVVHQWIAGLAIFDIKTMPSLSHELIESLLSAVIIAPIAEEYIYRRSLYARLRTFNNRSISIILCSLLFALSHQYNFAVTILGLLLSGGLCLIYEKTKVWWYAVAAHSAVNLSVVIYRLVER